MRQRVLDRAAREAFERRDHALIDHTLTAALLARDQRVDDDHHVDALHPARTILILLDDARMTQPSALAAAALLDSVRQDLLPADDAVDPGILAAARMVPTPHSTDSDSLIEALLALPDHLLDVALAERLDQARHLHLREKPLHAPGLALEARVYLPLAHRRGGLVGRRYARWHAAFTARLHAQR